MLYTIGRLLTELQENKMKNSLNQYRNTKLPHITLKKLGPRRMPVNKRAPLVRETKSLPENF